MSAFLLALFLLCITVGESQPTHPTSLVPDDGPQYSFRAGVLELRGGRGWLRTERLFLNFRVAFEFKATTPNADPGVFVRTWVSPQRSGFWSVWGYRIRLPTSITSEPAAVFVGRQRGVTVVQKGQVVLQPPNEWQSVEITGEGSQVSITLNGTRVGVFEVEEFGGYVLFNNEKGVVQFRDVSISSTEREPEIPDGVITLEQLKGATGKTPKLVREVKPHYTMDAMREKVQGVVAMQIVVMPDGSTGSVRVARSLHPDLDLSAIAAVRAWTFEPATLNDQKVAVLADVEMSFRLR
jgi:TonB family protein